MAATKLSNTCCPEDPECVTVPDSMCAFVSSTVGETTLPLVVKFLSPDATSALASSTKALFAAPAPFVMPSIFSKSVSFISVSYTHLTLPTSDLV